MQAPSTATRMSRAEWTKVVERLNASYPGQQLTPDAAPEWYDALCGFDAASVWLAIDRCRRELRFRPSLAEIFAAIDANDTEDRDRRRLAERAAQEADEGRRRGGVPMPPETRRAREILASRLKGDLDGRTARQMIEHLAGQLEARVRARGRPETVRDAVRVCADCASSPLVGWIVTEQDADGGASVWLPCPGCRRSRYEAVRAGVAHLEHDRKGWPTGWDEQKGA